MDLEDESDSDDESSSLLEGYAGLPGASPLPDVFTTSASLSTLNTTFEAHSEMMFGFTIRSGSRSHSQLPISDPNHGGALTAPFPPCRGRY